MKRLPILLAVAALFMTAGTVRAADGTWNADVSTNWGAGPWIGAAPGFAGDIAAFTNNITANRTVTNEAVRTIGGILFGDPTGGSAFTILGQQLTLDNGSSPALIGQYHGGASNIINVSSLILNSDLVVTSAAAGGWVVFSSPISGSGRSITFSGNGAQDVGQFSLQNNNSYSGGSTVRWSRVRLQNANGLGTGDVVIEPTGQVWLAANVVLTNAVTMSGPGWKETAGNLGAFRMDNGSRIAGSVTMAGDSRLTVWNATDLAEVSGAITGPFTLDKTGNGTLFLTADNSYGGTLISAGTVQVGRVTSTGSLGYGAITNNSVLQFQRTTDLVISNDVQGTGKLRQLNGSGTVTLLGSNSMGNLVVSSGRAEAPVVLGRGSTNLVTGIIQVGYNQAGDGTMGRLVISEDTSLRVDGTFYLGDQNTRTGEVLQAGGDVSIGGRLQIGHWPNNYSTYTMEGGTLRTTANVGANPFAGGEQNGVVYVGIDGSGAFRQNGGDVITAAVVLDNRGNTGPDVDLYTLAGGNLFIGQWGIQGNASTRFDAGGGSIIASNNLAITVPLNFTNITGATKISVPASGFVTLSSAYGNANVIVTNGTMVLADVGGRKTLAGDLSLLAGTEIRHVGSGMTLLSGDNSIGGLVVSNGTLGYALEASAGGASTPITVAGGILQVDGTTVHQLETHPMNWASFSGGIDVASPFNTVVLTTNIDGTGSFTKAGAGTLVLTSADHTYQGGTFVSNGTLRLVGGNDPLAVEGEVRVVRGTLDLGGNSQEVQGGVSFHGGAVVGGTINNTGLFGFDVQAGLVGVDLQGNVGITKATGGTATLVGDNGFTGDVQMNGGVLQVVRDENLGAGGDLNFAGGRLAIVGSAISNFNGRGVNWGTFNGGLDIVSSNYTFTLNNVISGPGSFTKGGGGTLVMNVANTYSGNTIVSNGTLVLAVDQATTGGTLIGAGSAMLQMGTGGTAGWIGGAITNNGTLRFLRSDTVVVSNTILGAGAVRQAGSGTIIITNALTAGSFFPQHGTVVITNGGIVQATGFASVGQVAGDNGHLVVNGSGIMRSTGDLNIGDTTGSRGLLLLQDAGVVTSRSFYVGKSGTAVGVYIQSNGTLRVGSGSDIRVGGGGGGGDAKSYGYVRQAGGEIHFGANYQMGAYGIGVHDMTGGILSNRSWITPGRWSGGFGQMNVMGGTVYVHNTGAGIIVGETGTSDLNIENANVLINGRLRIGGGTTGTGIVNIASGGVMVTPWVEKTGGEGFLNFHGGTLRLTANSATSMQGLNRATVWSEGGTMEITNGIVASVRQNIDAPLGNGVTSIAVADAGSGYVGTPFVRISGGGGTGATAIAEVDFSTGTITNFRITNPGHGYVTPPTIALLGGGASSAAYAGTVAIGAQTGGALTKSGGGMLSLVGTNTYAGGTFINGGLLAFGEPGPITVQLTNGVFATPGSPSLPTTGDITINAGGGLVASGVYANANAWLTSGRVASNSVGTIALTPTSTVENIDLSTIAGGAYTGLYVGAAQGTTLLYKGIITPAQNDYRLGGGGGVLIVNNDLALTGTGELRAGNHTGSNTVVWVGGSNTFAGGTTVDGSILSFAETNNLGTSSRLDINSGGVQIRGGTVQNFSAFTGNQTNMAGFMVYDIANVGNTFTENRDITVGGTLDKWGQGTMVLGGSNQITGALNIGNGVLHLTDSDAISGASTVRVSGITMGAVNSNRSAALWLSGGITVSNPLSLMGRGVNEDGALRSLDAGNIYAGPITILGNGYVSSRIASDAGVFTLLGPITNLAAGQIAYFGGAGDIMVSNSIAGGGAFAKYGTGTVTLTASNTYTGGTYIYNGGTLELDYRSGAALKDMVQSNSGLTFAKGTMRAISAASGTSTQVFNTVTVGPGYNAIIASNTAGGAMYLRMSGTDVARGLGQGTFDVSGDGTVVFGTSTTNVAGMKGSYVTVNNSDFAGMDAVGKVIPFAFYTNLTGAAPAMPNRTSAVVRINNGSTGNITIGSATSRIHSILVNDPAARTITMSGAGRLALSGGSGSSGAILLAPGAGGLTIGSAVNEGGITTFWTNNSATELILINNSANNLVLNSPVVNNGTGAQPLTIAGMGTGQTILNATNFINGRLYINSGDVHINGASRFGGMTTYGGTTTVGAASTLTGNLVVDYDSVVSINEPLTITGNNNGVQIGAAANSRSLLVINTNLWLPTGGRLQLATGTGANGAIIQNGGTFMNQNNAVIGDGSQNWAGYTIKGGEYSTTAGQEMNVAWRVAGVLDILGGSVVASNNWFGISRGDAAIGSMGIVAVNGGYLGVGVTNGGIRMNITGNARSYAQLSVVDGSVDVLSQYGNRSIDLMAASGNTGIVDLVGGSITANQIRASGTGLSVLNLNGGTLVVPGNSRYANGTISNLSAVYVHAGGAIIDNATNATIRQDLSGAFGYGLSSIPVTDGGSGYIGSPVVRILGGSGTGATAIAQVDLTTGSITNILITSPGSGYLRDDVLTVQVFGGGYTEAATLGAYTLAANANTGELIKIGAEPLTILGTTSYGGLTVVSNGAMILANMVGTNLMTGGISGPGMVTLDQAGPGMTIIGGDGSLYSGQLNVNSGVVQFASTTAAPVNDGQIVLGPGGTIVLDGTGVQSLINLIDGSGAIAVNANSANENVDLFGADLAATALGAVGTVTYGGTLTPYGGTYRLGGGGGTLIYTNAISSANVIVGLQEGLAIQGVSKVQMPNADSSVNVTIQTQGVLEVTSAGATIGTLSGGTGLYGWSNAIVNGSLTLGNAGDASFEGGISGTGSLTKMGSGTQVMSGNMTYTGLTTVGQGTLTLVGTNAQLGGAAFVSNGATLAIGGAGGYGLMGEYFTNMNVQVSSSVNLGWLNTNLSLRTSSYGSLPTSISNVAGNLDFGADANPTFPFQSLKNNFQARYTGRFIAPTNGTYWFGAASDDGSMLWVDGIMVSSNNYGQGTTRRGGYIELAAGVHDIVATWWQGTGGLGFYVDVAIPGGETNRITNTMLSWGPTVGNLNGEIGSMIALSNGTLTVGQTAAGTFAGTVTSDTSSVFYKSGPATLTLSGTNADFRGTMSAVNGVLKFASIQAVPANGTVNASTNGAMAFDFTGVQAALANVAATSTGTLAITATSAGDNLNFSGHQNLFLGAEGAQTYTGTLTPFGGGTGTNRLTGRFGTLTLANPITQGSVLIGNGAGTVILPNGSTYAGQTIFQSGTLQIGADSGLGSVPGAVATNIVFTSSSGILQAGADGIVLAANRAILVNGGFTGMVDTVGNRLTINGRIDGLNGTFTKIGNGTLALGSATNFITSLVIGQGGFSNSAPVGLLSNMFVGTMAGGATARFATNMAIAGRLYVGYGADRAGAVIQSGGTTTVGTALSGADVLSLGNNGGYGYYRLDGGVLNAGQLAFGGNSAGGNSGVFDQFGGVASVVNGGGWLLVWNALGGAMNIWNGSMYAPPNNNSVAIGHTANANSYGVMNVLGAGAMLNTMTGTTTRAIDLMYSGGNAAGIMNINNGGLVLANQVKASSTAGLSVFNLDGGILQANAGLTQTAFMQGLSGAYVYDGGGTIDSSNSTIGIHQALLQPIGYGITNIAITSGGAGYIGAPVVRITGGSGTGATAVAQVDLATGAITNIYITSMGSGYLPSDSLDISLVGGGAATPATLGTVGWDTNSPSGGLVKLGNGTLMLGGDNTYLGGTVVSNGNLQIGLGGTTGSVVGAITFMNTNSWFGFNRTDVITNGYSLVTPNGDIQALVQNGRGGTVVLTNTAPVFKSVIVNTGNVMFSSTAAIPGAGMTISNAAGSTRGAVIAAGAYDTASGWLASGRIASNFAGAIVLTGSTAENLDMLPLPIASIGAAPGTAVTYLGTLTPATNTYYIGGGGGELVMGLANQLVDNNFSNRNVVVGNGGGGIVRLMGANTYNGGTLVNNGTLIVESDESLGTGPLTLIGTAFAGGTLQITNAPFYQSDRVVVFTTGGGSNVLDVGAGSTAVWHGVLSSSGAGFVHRMGNGTLVLTNATLSGDASVFERFGTTIIDSGAAMYTAARYHNVGFTGGDNATLTVRGNGIFTNNADFNIADIGGTGVLNVQDSATVVGTTYYVGKAGNGTVNQSGGLIHMNGNAVVGNGGAAVGVINQTGGILSVGNLTLGATLTSQATDNLNGGVQVIRGTVLGRTIAPTNIGTAVLNMNGGTLRAGNNFVISNLSAMAMNGSGGIFDPSNYVMTVNQIVSGAGRLTVAGAGSTGIVALTAANTYSGGTFANNAILRFDQTNTVAGSGRNVTVNYGGTVAFNQQQGPAFLLGRITNTSVGTIALMTNLERVVDLRNNALTNLSVGAIGTVGISGSLITNAGSTFRLGGGWGTLILSNGIIRGVGTNMVAFGGGSGGALRLLGTNLLDNYQVNGGLVQFATISGMGSRVTSRAVEVNRGGSVSTTGNVVTADFLGHIAAASSGTVAVVAHQTGALDFNAAGLTAASLGAANGTWTLSGALTPAAGSYRLGGGGGTLNVTNRNALTGANTLMAFGAGSGGDLVLNNTNDYSGGTWIGPTGTVRAATYGLGSGPVTNNGLLILGQGVSGVLASAISGPGVLIKSNTGTVVLSGANTYSGGTAVNNGNLVLANLSGEAVGNGMITVMRVGGSSQQVQLWLGSSNQIPDTAVLVLTNGATAIRGDARFDLQGYNETIGGLIGGVWTGGNVIVEAAIDGLTSKPATLTIDTAGGHAYTYTGYVRNGTGAGSVLSLVKDGAGMQTLVGNVVTYSGPTRIDGGILMLSNTTAFASDVTINDGHLLLGTQTAANNRNITNNAVNGLAFGTFTNAYTIGMLNGTGDVALIGGTGGGVALTLGNQGSGRGVYSGVLSDAGPGNYYMGSLIKVGASTQVLTGANSYRGGTTISAGGLLIGEDANLGYANAPVTLNGGQLIVSNTMTMSDRPVTVTAGSYISVWTGMTLTMTNHLIGTQALTKDGEGVLLLNADNSDYVGNWSVRSGIVRVANSYGLGAWGTGVVNNNGQGGPANGNLHAVELIGGITVSGKVMNTSGSGYTADTGVLRNISGTNQWLGNIILTAGAGATTIGSDSGLLVLGGWISPVATAGRTLTFTGAGDHHVMGAISNGATINMPVFKNGAGTLTLSGDNQYSGQTLISAGTLQVGNGGATGILGSGIVSNNSLLAFNRSNDMTVGNLIEGTGAVEQRGSGRTILTNVNTYTGMTHVMAGVLELSGVAAISNSTTLQIDAGASMVVTGLTSTMHLVSGQTLQGVGTFECGLITDSGSLVRPGTSPGALTVNGNWQMDALSTYTVELNGLSQGAQYDALIFGTGYTLTLNNPELSVLLGFAPAVGNVFQIVDGLHTGTFNGRPDEFEFDLAYSGTNYTVRIDYNLISGGDATDDITLTVIPEPLTGGLLGLMGLAGWLLRRRLRGQK